MLLYHSQQFHYHRPLYSISHFAYSISSSSRWLCAFLSFHKMHTRTRREVYSICDEYKIVTIVIVDAVCSANTADPATDQINLHEDGKHIANEVTLMIPYTKHTHRRFIVVVQCTAHTLEYNINKTFKGQNGIVASRLARCNRNEAIALQINTKE